MLFALTGTCLANQDTKQYQSFDQKQALAFSQGAINNKISNFQFIDQHNTPVELKQFLGKPVVISFIYTSCYHTCPILTNHLADVVTMAREALGDKSFYVISVGFDTEIDSPERMQLFASERGINIPDWNFLSADQETIDALSNESGFIFFRSPKGFDHLAQTTVLDRNGKVYRQIYGQVFDPPLLVEPLKELVYGQPVEATFLSGWLDNIRLFCTTYDPASGRYRFDYSVFMGIGIGILALGAIALFIIRSWREHDTKRSV